jgi:hypothetical protein
MELFLAFAKEEKNYVAYHQSIILAEKMIAEERYGEALEIYDKVFNSYEFIFLKDYRIATQLALYEGRVEVAFDYLRKGINSGWKMKSIKKNDLLKQLRALSEWKSIKDEYPSLRKKYEAGLDPELKKEVKKMFGKDQRKAIGALLKYSSNGQDRYAEQKFAPHSEIQMADLDEILEKYGYPGEKLIGNDIWMSTILSHHNSISTEYNRNDTIYNYLKPKLRMAMKQGDMSPYEYALVDNWFIAVSSDRSVKSYGYIDGLSSEDIPRSNHLRKNIGVRSIETRNRLIDIQEKTGMDFYLQGSPWQNGKILP